MTSLKHQRIIAIWLFISAATIFAMVILGGVTRLTDSGLSMVEWAPIMGALPPMGHDEWNKAFQLYQQFPEYKIHNHSMNLSDFKSIFWFEYSHRLLGRVIGMIFFFTMVFFFIKGWVAPLLKIKLIVMFILGGLQGLLGWYMVKSGLVNNPDVSQYRLVAHLGLALFVYAYILWIGLGLFFQGNQADQTVNFQEKSSIHSLKPYTLWLIFFAFITLLSGGFVAGLKAGHVYNTFPLMNGQLIPDGLLSMTPVWLNMFENIMTVQFNHRVLTTTLALIVLIFYVVALRKNPSARLKRGLHLMMTMVIIQVTLGISTLLLHVPIPLAASHQAGALLLFTLILFVTHQIRQFKIA